MVAVYGVIAFISLYMVGACVLADKKHDIWLLLVFVSVSVCNIGYFMLSISNDLIDALNANRISYLGSVFLPFFMLMMVLRFCGMQRSRPLMITLVAVGVVMLAITISPGILPIYYSSVDITFVDGVTNLVREYGPFHLLYYVYLVGYMAAMVAVTFYAIAKKRIKSRRNTALLLCIVFCNIVIWLLEQLLPRGFEWLSLSYIITECLILAIYRSMQKLGQINQNERTQSYTVNVLLTVFLLLFANFLRVIAKDATEAMYAISHVVILLIYIGVFVSWTVSVYDRIINRAVRRYLIVLVGLMLLWMLMRTLLFTVFNHVLPLGRWCWYAYFISMILIPQVCLFAAKYIGKPEEYRLPKAWYMMYIPSVALIIGILTSDLHQWAFRFYLGYEAGWDIYQRTFLYYAATAWIFACIALMIVEIIKNCRIPNTKERIWPPLAALGIGVLYSALYALNSSLFGFVEITAALCFTVIAVWESSIKAGLIQSNSHYDELLKYSELGVIVADNDYTVHFCSDDALALSNEQMQKALESPLILNGGIRVSASKIRGGYALWQEDLSELLDILGELQELREELKDANAVSMQNYQMKKRIRTLAEKNRLHDELHRQTAHQIDLLNSWLRKLAAAKDADEKRELLRHIVVVGAYLKRRYNLILVSEQDGIIKEEEMTLSIEEMTRNMQLAGVNCACSVRFGRDLKSDVAMRLFDFCEYVVENAFDGLEHLLVRFFSRESSCYCCVDAVCSLDLTALQSDMVSVSVSDENCYTLSFQIEGGGSK